MADPMQEQQAGGAKAEAETPLLDSIMAETKLKPTDESYSIAKRGLEAFMQHLLSRRGEAPQIRQAIVNEMIAELDKKLSAQVDEILHHKDVQKLESAWRGLKMVVDRTDFRENTKIEILNASKEDLLSDFEDSPEIVKSGLYKLVYTENYGVFGGEPVGAMVANFEFGAGPQDISLMKYCAAVGAMAHAPFIAGTSPDFFGVKSWQALPNLKDLHAIFEGPQYAKWNGFRETEDARYLGLTIPRYLLRLPYGPGTIPCKSFDYQETTSASHDSYLWGNASFAFATRLTDAFAKYRFCSNIIGPRGGGAVEDLPVHTFESMGEVQAKIPTEILLSERREFELAEEGFIGLTMRKGTDNACFFSANSAQKPKFYGKTKEGKEAEANYRLGLQLPYIFLVSRLAHYLKVLQREEIGSTKSRVDMEQELNKWISQFVMEMDVAPPGAYAKRPLRAAHITVEDVEGEPGWYKVGMKVKPHFKYMGAFFELSLVGKLDKK